MIKIEVSDQIMIPDQIDHLPPGMLAYLMKTNRFKMSDFGVDAKKFKIDKK